MTEKGINGMRPAWPPVMIERRDWKTNPDQRGISGARPNHADRMLTEISCEIPAPLADREVPLGPSTTGECQEAMRDIISLDQRIDQSLAPLNEYLLRSESLASSRIERVNSSFDDVALAAIGEESSPAARSTLAAIKAMSALTSSCDNGKDLREESILAAHFCLLEDDLLEGQFTGHLRVQQNWVGGSDFPREPQFIFPHRPNLCLC